MSLGIPRDAKVVGLVGNINPQKGIEYFVEAAQILRDRFPDLHFIIVGARLPTHATYAERIDRAIATADLSDRVRFLGSRGDIESCYAAMHVLLLTSVPASEGIPTVIGEALATGVPPVVTEVGAVREVVHHDVHGYVVPPGDSGALADYAGRILANQALRTRLGTAGRSFAQASLGLDQCVDDHLEAIDLALEHRRRRNPDRRASILRKPTKQ